MKKRIFSILVALAMIVGMLPTVAFATEDTGTTLTSTLTLTSSAYDGATGFTWTESETDSGTYDTLTLTSDLSITIDGGADAGIDVPAGTTIDLGEYDLRISVPSYGIYTAGTTDTTLTIKGSGILAVTSTSTNSSPYAIYAKTGNLAIEGTSDKITVEAKSDFMAIRANSGNISIKNATVTATVPSTTDSGIFAVGDLTIDNSTVTSAAESGYSGISVGDDLTISGTSNVIASYIGITGDCSISDSASITATRIDVDGELSISDGATLTIAEYTYGSNTYTLYGAMVDEGWMFSRGNAVAFAVNSSLTITAGSTTDFSDYTIDWENAKITNNGTLILPDDTKLDDALSCITFGTGAYIVVDGTVYDNNGNTVHKDYSGTLTLTLASGTAFDGIAYGFTWDESNKILTVSEAGLTIVADSGNGLDVPSGTKIILNGDLTITANNGYGIYASGALTINGTGDLTINANEGICGGFSTIDGTGQMNITASDRGICTNGDLTIESGEITIDANTGISVSDGTAIIKGGTLNITADGNGIVAEKVYSSGNITISGGTINITADDGIYADDGDVSITGGTLDITAEDNGIYASDNITITGGTITIDAGSDGIWGDGEYISIDGGTITLTGGINNGEGTIIINSGTVTSAGMIKAATTYTIEADATVTGVVSYDADANTEDDVYDYQLVVYGDVTLTADLADAIEDEDYNYNGLSFNTNATLTIPAGVTLDLSSATLTMGDGTLVVDGVLMLTEEPAFTNISGDGIIQVDEDYYDTDGGALTVLEGGLELTETQVTADENKGYTWILEDDTYTLTFDYDVVMLDGSIDILVSAPVVFNVTRDIIVGEIYFGMTSPEITYNLTISGDSTLSTTLLQSGDVAGTLTINSDVTTYNYINIYGDLTIGSDATVVATTGTMILGEVTIDGDFTSTMLLAVDSLTINDGATVTLTGIDLTEFDTAPTLALALVDSSFMTGEDAVAPTLILGDNISVLTPSGGEYKAVLIENWEDSTFYFGSIATGTGGFELGNWSNMASSITFGETPVIPDDDSNDNSSNSGGSSYSGTTTTTTTATTTTNDDGSVTATATTSTSTSGTTVTATVTDSNVDTAIENAVEAADGDTAIVEIAVTTKDSTDTVSATISPDAMTAIADSDVDALVVTSDLGTVAIPSDALESIVSQATGTTVTITLELVDSSVLTQTQQTAVGDAQIYDLHISSDGEKITEFDGAEITVTLPYELAEDESAEHIVIWYLGDDGSMEALEGTYDEESGTATFATPHFSYYAALHHNNPFDDVTVEDYYFSPVMWAVENGITNGTTDTTFSPSATCTRAQAVTLLWKAYGSPVVDDINPFTDVSSDAYYYEAVLWAVSEGITAGTNDSTFSPDADCTRGQIVTFLYRAAEEPEVETSSTFTDVDSDSYCYDAVLWAVANGITNGTTDTTFSPNSLCNRGQIVTFLYRNLAD